MVEHSLENDSDSVILLLGSAQIPSIAQWEITPIVQCWFIICSKYVSITDCMKEWRLLLETCTTIAGTVILYCWYDPSAFLCIYSSRNKIYKIHWNICTLYMYSPFCVIKYILYTTSQTVEYIMLINVCSYNSCYILYIFGTFYTNKKPDTWHYYILPITWITIFAQW
jgi:hypothetical protein